MEAVIIPAIGGSSFTIYGTVAERDAYLLASFRWSATWTALSADQRNMASKDVAAMFDRQLWVGTPTQSYPDAQPNQWPRNDIGTINGVAYADGTTPKPIDYASYELAAMAAEDPDILASAQDVLVQTAKAGSASVTFFAPQQVGRFANAAMELLSAFLAGASNGSAAGEAFGTDGESDFDDEDAFGLDGSL